MILEKVGNCMELGASQGKGLGDMEGLGVCGAVGSQRLQLSDQGGSVRSQSLLE